MGVGTPSPCNLASDAGEGDAVALGLYVGRVLLEKFGGAAVGNWGCRKVIACKFGAEWYGRVIFFEGSGIDVVAGAAALLFDFGEMRNFAPVGFGFVEPSEGVEAGALGLALGNDYIRHADDGRGVHAAGKFGEDGAVGAEAALDGCGQGGAEVFFVFGVGAVADALARIEVPIFSDDVFCAVLSRL